MDARAYVAERALLVEPVLDAAVPALDAPPAALHAAMRHLLFPGGKRFRPVLAMAGAEAVGAPPERALPVAAAVELVHVYSLIHDDLPCMDDDALRRGQPTVHVAYGEAVAVLAGDALLACAFEVLARADAQIPADRRLGALADVAVAAGSLGLVGGQVDDLAYDSKSAGASTVESIHARKSAALIGAAVVGGARLGGGDEATLAQLGRFGTLAGIVFQIADDLLDADSDDACSLVGMLGADGARARAEALLESALGSIEDLGERAEPLRDLARYAFRRGD